MINRNKKTGFTLIEIAIVLLVVTILIGYTVAMVPVQQELKQYRQVDVDIDDIINHLIAFAQVNGRLPCPDTEAGSLTLDGVEDSIDAIDNNDGSATADGLTDDCVAYYGYVPARTLGMSSGISTDGVLRDPWGQVYRYAVSESDFGTGFGVDLVSPNGIQQEGISNITPDLFICDDSPVFGNDLNCVEAASNPVAENVAAVIVSTGKNFDPSGISYIQLENVDQIDAGILDKVFVYASRSNVASSEYDDVVKWISPNLLFSKMIEASQLP